MKEVIINGSGRNHYNNALHAQFGDHSYRIVSSVEAELINLPTELTTEWRAAIDMEIEINRKLQASASTQQLVETDALRDSYITYAFEEIRNQCRSPFAEKKRAAEHLVLYVDKYKGLQSEAADVETLHIKGLLADLREGANAAYCTTLGLDELLNLIEATNNEYENIKDNRTTERSDEKTPNSKDARKVSDKLYDQVCKIIEVSYLITTNTDAKATIAELVTKMNQYIDETKASYHQMEAAAKK